MNETNELNQELIPGTNIPRPRNREVTETDQQYVEYLKAYYEQYFPEPVQEQVVEPIEVAESVNDVTEDVIKNEELNSIRDNLENYADQIIEQQKTVESETVTQEPTSFEVNTENNIAQEPTFGFDTSVEQQVNNIQQEVIEEEVESPVIQTQSEITVEPSISFDVSPEEKNDNLAPFDITITDEEVASYTSSNPTLNSNIRKPGLLTNIVNFFKRKKTNMDDLVTKAGEYFEDISTSLEKDNLIPAVGRVR